MADEKVYKTWVTSDDALTLRLYDDFGETTLSVEEDGGEPVILALDSAGIEEVIGFLTDANKLVKKIEKGEEVEPEGDDEEEEEEEEHE